MITGSTGNNVGHRHELVGIYYSYRVIGVSNRGQVCYGTSSSWLIKKSVNFFEFISNQTIVQTIIWSGWQVTTRGCAVNFVQ